LQVKTATTIVASPDVAEDATAGMGSGGASGAVVLEKRLQQQTGGGQPGPIKGAIEGIISGAARMMQGGQQE
jgi:hypothetical protein